MYQPRQFEENDPGVLHALMRANPLATLVMLLDGALEANHIPLLLAETSPATVLRGHVARANPLWRHASGEREVLAIFHGPQAYITPSWYATKAEHGKVVPTWNYAAVHVYGTLRAIDDPEWLRAQLESLTAHNEVAFAQPWKMSDAPRDYTEKLMAAIVGIELTVTRMAGKWKVSQNQPAENIAGIVNGLCSQGEKEMAALVEQRAARLPERG
jgi:transcriptional regulator